jgi:DNA-directed RNA polymerase specialized sigma24 family protein
MAETNNSSRRKGRSSLILPLGEGPGLRRALKATLPEPRREERPEAESEEEREKSEAEADVEAEAGDKAKREAEVSEAEAEAKNKLNSPTSQAQATRSSHGLSDSDLARIMALNLVDSALYNAAEVVTFRLHFSFCFAFIFNASL